MLFVVKRVYCINPSVKINDCSEQRPLSHIFCHLPPHLKYIMSSCDYYLKPWLYFLLLSQSYYIHVLLVSVPYLVTYAYCLQHNNNAVSLSLCRRKVNDGFPMHAYLPTKHHKSGSNIVLGSSSPHHYHHYIP